ncbi:MAG: DUF4893 domain-containing protein [Pseudomonadota bacterium]|nr:DUF4893 domain-containing protein [Pseudomonadota bacterium]
MMRLIFTAVLVLLASACTQVQPGRGVIAQPQRDWRAIATADDRARLRDWRSAFVDALAAARRSGHAADIAREGVLMEPDAAVAGAAIPNGMYRCRITKLGAKSEGLLDYVAYPAFSCRIRQERDLQGFAKLSGSQRQVGLIFPGDGVRQIFLGTLVLGDEARAMQYGMDRDRDVAGWMERIGPARWRMLMPRPRFESQMDVMELIPER